MITTDRRSGRLTWVDRSCACLCHIWHPDAASCIAEATEAVGLRFTSQPVRACLPCARAIRRFLQRQRLDEAAAR